MIQAPENKADINEELNSLSKSCILLLHDRHSGYNPK